MIGGLIALAIPTFGISLAYAYGEYDVPWGWIYIFITPWHLVTLVGLYYVTMAYLIKEKRKRK